MQTPIRCPNQHVLSTRHHAPITETSQHLSPAPLPRHRTGRGHAPADAIAPSNGHRLDHRHHLRPRCSPSSAVAAVRLTAGTDQVCDRSGLQPIRSERTVSGLRSVSSGARDAVQRPQARQNPYRSSAWWASSNPCAAVKSPHAKSSERSNSSVNVISRIDPHDRQIR